MKKFSVVLICFFLSMSSIPLQSYAEGQPFYLGSWKGSSKKMAAELKGKYHTDIWQQLVMVGSILKVNITLDTLTIDASFFGGSNTGKYKILSITNDVVEVEIIDASSGNRNMEVGSHYSLEQRSDDAINLKLKNEEQPDQTLQYILERSE